MVKYFCDRCGREIPEDNRFVVNGNKMDLLCWDIDKDVSEKQKKLIDLAPCSVGSVVSDFL